MRAVQVIPPHLPVGIDAVGAFAATLGSALERASSMETSVVQGGRVDLSGGSTGLPWARANALILHYVNYGYAPRGCPFWLVRALSGWKRQAPGRRMLTVFHEVAASGPPWRSSFWLRPFQLRIAARIARMSDWAVVSLELHRREIARWLPGQDIRVLPVFSTIGEPVDNPPLSARARRMVVIGGRPDRLRLYTERRQLLVRATAALGIREIADVGVPLGREIGRIGDCQVTVTGVLSAAELSRLLLESRAGCSVHRAAFLAKSTAFAAYCAHGVIPVCLDSRTDVAVPCFAPGAEIGSGEAPLQRTAEAARDWYQGHSVRVHARLYQELLGER